MNQDSATNAQRRPGKHLCLTLATLRLGRLAAPIQPAVGSSVSGRRGHYSLNQ